MALNKKIASALLAVAVVVSAAPNAFAAPIELNIGSADDGSVIDDGKGTDVSLSVGVFSDESDIKSISPVTPVAGVAEVTDSDDSLSDADVEETVTVEGEIDYVMANVSDVANVREEPNEDSKIVGKLYKNCTGKIVEPGEGWTKIQSGKLVGWVKDEFLLFDDDAKARMEEVGTLKATSLTDALRVRKEPNEEAGVYKLLELNETIVAVEELDGWVSVKVDDETTGYVSADYVSVEFDAEHGKTTEQIEAEIQAKKEADAKVARTKNRGKVATGSDDVKLLAALIQAEAGSQPYEGKIAVGAVVMNRVRSGGYPNSIHAVITQPGQFPPATNGTVSAILARGPSSSCMQAAQAAVDGATTVGGALHFGSASRYSGIVIGGHAFY